MALGLHALLGFTDDGRRLVRHLAADLVEELLMGIVARELGYALELGGLLADELLELTAALLNLACLARELVLTLVEGVVAAIERLLALHDAVLHGAEFLLALLLFRLGGLLALEDLLLCLEKGLLLERLRLSLRIAYHLVCLGARRLDGRVRLTKAPLLCAAHGDRSAAGTKCQADDTNQNLHANSLRKRYP